MNEIDFEIVAEFEAFENGLQSSSTPEKVNNAMTSTGSSPDTTTKSDAQTPPNSELNMSNMIIYIIIYAAQFNFTQKFIYFICQN